MVTIEDLAIATQNSYGAYNDDPQKAIEGFRVLDVSHARASKENHSAVAYYNEDSYEVIIAHRGSVGIPLLAYDWLVTDRDIAFGNANTNADIDAVSFTRKTLDILSDEGLPVNRLFQTGHSKGGHEAQVCTAAMTNNFEEHNIPTTSITFNAPGVRDINKKMGVQYDHVNLRVESIFVGDIVSLAGGEQLGRTVNVKAQASELLLSAHTMSAVKSSLIRTPTLAKVGAVDFVESSKTGGNLHEILSRIETGSLHDHGEKIENIPGIYEYRVSQVERTERKYSEAYDKLWTEASFFEISEFVNLEAGHKGVSRAEVASQIRSGGSYSDLAKKLQELFDASDCADQMLLNIEKAATAFVKHYERAINELGNADNKTCKSKDELISRVNSSRERIQVKNDEMPAEYRVKISWASVEKSSHSNDKESLAFF